jgi:hypothetical protein
MIIGLVMCLYAGIKQYQSFYTDNSLNNYVGQGKLTHNVRDGEKKFNISTLTTAALPVSVD